MQYMPCDSTGKGNVSAQGLRLNTETIGCPYIGQIRPRLGLFCSLLPISCLIFRFQLMGLSFIGRATH